MPVRVNKIVYILLALFLGGLGIHKFYAGHVLAGVLYILFSWTGIPLILTIIDIIVAIITPTEYDGCISV